jgi:hypothetical protein
MKNAANLAKRKSQKRIIQSDHVSYSLKDYICRYSAQEILSVWQLMGFLC